MQRPLAYTVQEEIIRDFSEGTSVKCERSDCVELKKTERNKFKVNKSGEQREGKRERENLNRTFLRTEDIGRA